MTDHTSARDDARQAADMVRDLALGQQARRGEPAEKAEREADEARKN